MSAIATTFYEIFADNLLVEPHKPFVIDPQGAFTYQEVAIEADRVATWLEAKGIGLGDRVIVQLRKSMREVAAMLGVAKVGAVLVNVNAGFSSAQLEFIASDCGARALILEPGIAKTVLGRAGGAEVMAGHRDGPHTGWASLPACGAAPAARLDTELAAIIYTSGSTGLPKGVMLSHRNILAGTRSVARYLALRSDDRLLSVLPYSFDYGLNQLTTMMLVGGTIVHQPVSLPSEVVRAMRTHAVTGLAAVPPLWIQLVRLLDAAPATFPALRRITNSGGKIPDCVLERMADVFPGADIYLMYGLTEAFRSTYLPPDKFREKMGSIGRAIPGSEVYVIQEGVGVAGPGAQGELVHRGPLVSQGYWNNPAATAEKIRPCPELAAVIGAEPVVYSGDVVRIDEDGDLWFVGRKDGLIKTSGFRVSPEEVEDFVHRSGLVADVVAFGITDELLGQSVHVAATLLPGASRESVMTHCQHSMPAYMVPREIHLWPQPMPRTASGKLARPEVIERCQAESGQGRSPSFTE